MNSEHTETTIDVQGTTTEQTTGAYGEQGCEETLHVVNNGQDVYIPFNDVRASAYDYYGAVPDRFDVDRIVLYDGAIHAEADVDNGVVELIPYYNKANTELKGYDSWELHYFDADTVQEGVVAWERD